MSEFEDTGAIEAESVETVDAGSEAEGSGPQGAGESEGGGQEQSAGQAPQQSASAAPAKAAPAGLSREQFEAHMRQRDAYWESQRKADREEIARLKRMYSRPPAPPTPQAQDKGPLPTLQEWIQKGYTPESWEMLNGMNSYHEKRYQEVKAYHDSIRKEMAGQQRKAQQREIESALDKGWSEAMADVYAKEFKHLSGNADLDGLLKKALFVEAFQAIQSKKDPRFMDNRAILRGVLSVVDKLVKAGMAKQVKTAPAPAAPATRGAPTKPGEQKTKARSEKEFFDGIAARARAAID